VIYYDSLHEAVYAANGTSVDLPDEITLLADVVLDEPLIIDDGVHIRLVVDGNRTIWKSGNLIDYPVFWVRGDGASLTLGKPDMGHELIIDGGYLNSQPVQAHAPLIALNGPGAKLIMYDKVALQNNYNSAVLPATSFYQHGSGVFIRTLGDLADRQAEFIMRGGTIRGNINNTQSPIPFGGGVLNYYYGIFTMEGGVIMNNTAHQGGGYYTSGLGSFRKTGGIIYGANAPAVMRNTATVGLGVRKCYGHSVAMGFVVHLLWRFRADTVGESDSLSYIGNAMARGTFGRGEKWDTPDKVFWRLLAGITIPFIAVVVFAIIVLRRSYLKKLNKIIQEAVDTTPEIDLTNMGLSDGEKDICELLLSNRPLKEIAPILKLSYQGANHRAQKLYKKLGIENRTELLVRVKSEK
jgi:DNA-binding CsgD family transcriptional regulator